MSRLFDFLDKKKAKDIRILGNFVHVYCHQNHKSSRRSPFELVDERLEPVLGQSGIEVCENCCRLLNHGIAKLLQCPFDPKPACRKCPDPCYSAEYRREVKKVMRFSGTYLVKHGRLDLLLHYLK